MSRFTSTRRGVAAGIAGAGLAVGGLGIASATDDGAQSDSSTPAASSSTDSAFPERGDSERGPGRGPGGGPGGGRELGGAELADALGVSETELQSALQAVREQLEPSPADRSTPPTDVEHEERRTQVIGALAEELDLSAAEVSAAFEELQQAREDERRTALGDRLDEAVTAGDLTTEDRAAVLKAFDAGVLGGPEAGRGAR